MKRLLVVVIASVFAASGCYTARADLPGALRNDLQPADTENLGTLAVEKKHYFLLNGLLGKPSKDFLAAEIKAQVQKRGGDGVAGLVYESEHTCGDAALGTCTLGCFVPRTYRVTGTVVRIRAPRLPGRPAKLVDAAPSDERVRLAQRF
jgi:hypothetical protein